MNSGVGVPYSDGRGGVYVVGFQYRDDPDWIQRLSFNGAAGVGWPATGRLFPGGFGVNEFPSVVNEPSGGVYFIFSDLFNDRRIEALHYTASGDPSPGWGDSTGVLTIAGRPVSFVEYPRAIADGSGGFFVTWTRHGTFLTEYADTIRVRRIRDDGSSYPGWPDAGVDLCHAPGQKGTRGIVADGLGGVMVVWWDERRGGIADVYAQRVAGSGDIVWSTFPQGVPVAVGTSSRLQFPTWVIGDGTGGFFAGILNEPSGGASQDAKYWLQHIAGDGTRVPGYGPLGKPIAIGEGWRQRLELEPDGSGGLFACWEDYRDVVASGFYLQHFGPDGEPKAGWPVGGRDMRPTIDAFDYFGHMCTDMAGGVYCTWLSQSDEYRVFTSHVQGDGQLAPGWPEGGLEMTPGRYAYFPYIASDAHGGAIITWVSRLDDDREVIYAQRYGPASVVATALSLISSRAEPGSVSLAWQVGGDALMSASLERRSQSDAEWTTLATLTPDGERRLRYEDRAVVAGERYAYRLAYSVAGDIRRTAESWIEIPTAHVFAFHGPSRSPSARGALSLDLSLRGTGPARLELYDVTGRRVIARDLRGTAPGRRTLAVPEAATLEAGLYWARLSEGSDEARARVVLLQ